MPERVHVRLVDIDSGASGRPVVPIRIVNKYYFWFLESRIL